MGQSQSARDQSIDEGPAYHPSAIGYSVPSSSPTSRKLKLLYNGNNEDNGQKISMIGPMRIRVKSRQPKASFSPALVATRKQINDPSTHRIPFAAPISNDDVSFPEKIDNATSSPSMSASPMNSNRGNERRISAIPIHPSIVEVSEPDTVDVVAAPTGSDQQVSSSRPLSEPVSPALADALKIGLGKRYLNLEEAQISSPVGSIPTDVDLRKLPDELLFLRPSSHRLSWSPGLGGEATLPSLITTQHWSSQWEDRRGLGSNNDDSNEEGPNSTASDLQLPAQVLYNTDSPRAIKRKPVPMLEDWDQIDSSTQTTPLEVGNQQRILWPALAEAEESLLSKHNSYVSRASATTEALHSHVEKIRAGPVYQVDPDASALLQASGSFNDLMEANNPTSVTASPMSKRSRGLSFMAKIKDRVRKNSDATILTLPIAPVPSTPEIGSSILPLSPSSPFNVLDTKSGQDLSLSPQSRSSLGLLGRKKSNKKVRLATIQAQLFANGLTQEQQPRRQSIPSSRPRSSRQSVRSVNSAKSIRSKRSRRGDLESWKEKENESILFSTKQRSSSQPVPNNQQWWKGQITWPRRASVGIRSRTRREEADTDAGWIDDEEDEEEEDQARSLPTMSTQRRKRIVRHAEMKAPSPTGEELVAMEQEQYSSKETRQSPPFAVIGRDNMLLPEQYNYGSVQYSSSSSFTSLAPPPVQTPMPPPRRSRRVIKHADSSSNGEDSSSAAASPLPDLNTNTSEDLNNSSGGKVSPLSIDTNGNGIASLPELTVNHASKTLHKTARPNHDISDADSKEILLSDSSSDQYWQETQLEGDQMDYNMRPSVDCLERHVQSAALSPFGTRHQSLALQDDVKEKTDNDDDDDDDGFTVMEPVTATRRPLPAPPVLAEPRTVLDTVTRSNSTGSTRAGSSTFGGQTSIASMKKHTGTQKRPLPPTPGRQNSKASSRAVSLPLQPLKAPFKQEAEQESDLVESLLLSKHKRGIVRESWTSADGPWYAETVQATTISPAKGIAKATVQSGKQASPLHNRIEIVDTNWTEEKNANQLEAIAADAADSNRVPFAETAVQASLAALEAIERSKQGNDWQSRWAREKLMGAFAVPNKMSIPSSSSRNNPSTGQMSDYSNSRSRRRAAPYGKSREDVSSSAEDRGRKSVMSMRKKGHGSRHLMVSTSSASQIGGQSNVAGGFTSDSDRAVLNHCQRSENNTGSRRSRVKTDVKLKAATPSTRRNPISSPFSTPLDSTRALQEDINQKATLALAQRFGLEDERELKVVTKRGLESYYNNTSISRRADVSDDGKTSRSRRTKRRSETKKHHPSSSSSFTTPSRLPKIRKGYGCDDIKAWQASLNIAVIPVSLVE